MADAHRNRPRGVRIGRMSRAAISANNLAQATQHIQMAAAVYRRSLHADDKRERRAIVAESITEAQLGARLALDVLLDHHVDVRSMIAELVAARAEDDGTRRTGATVAIRIDSRVLTLVRRAARARGIPPSAIIDEMIGTEDPE